MVQNLSLLVIVWSINLDKLRERSGDVNAVNVADETKHLVPLSRVISILRHLSLVRTIALFLFWTPSGLAAKALQLLLKQSLRAQPKLARQP